MNKKTTGVHHPAKGEDGQKKKVIMEAVFMVHTETGMTLEEYCEMRKGYVDIGGFEIIADGKTIPFDFESVSWWKNKTNFPWKPENPYWHTYVYSNYSGFGAKIHDVDPCHEEDWAEAGLTPEDITAELLGSAEELTEFYFALYDEMENPIPHTLEVKSMRFENEKGKTFAIDKKVLMNYNRKLRKELKI